jgi:hypothetical protein
MYRTRFPGTRLGVEREAKGRDAPVRLALRIEQALPVLGRFRRWLDEQADVVLPKSPIGEAVGDARAQWTALTRYCEDGRLAIDNNVAERALRMVVTGRRNWLFCGSDAGRERAAILYCRGSASARRRLGCVGIRSSTSRRYAHGSIPWALHVATTL